MCDDGVYRCIGCAVEDGFDIQTGLPVETAAYDGVLAEKRVCSNECLIQSKFTSDYRRARGVLPWKDGDELPEDTIRRLRGG